MGPSQWAPTRGGRCSSTRSGNRGRTSCPCWRRSPRRRLRRGSMGRLPRRPAGRKRRRMKVTTLLQKKKRLKVKEKGEQQKTQKKMERDRMRKEKISRKPKSREARSEELRRPSCFQ